MKDRWDKLKISSDVLKANWPIILAGLTLLGSGLTNLGQLIVQEETDILNVAMKDQITILANTYVKPKQVTVRSNCGQCLPKSEFDKFMKDYNDLHL